MPGRKLQRGSGPASKEYELDCRECDAINSALSDQTDVSGAKSSYVQHRTATCFKGQMTGHEGFLIEARTAAESTERRAESAEVISRI